MKSRRNNNGFTLLELTVALSLTALLVTVLMTGIKTAGHALNLVDNVSESSEVQRSLTRFFRTKLSHLFPYLEHQQNFSRQWFSGSREEIQFAVIEPVYQPRGGIALYRIFTDTLGAKPIVRVTLQKLNSSTERSKEIVSTELRGLLDIKFEYFGKSNGGRDATWHSSWLNQQTIPSLVRIHFRSQNDVTQQSVIPIRSHG